MVPESGPMSVGGDPFAYGVKPDLGPADPPGRGPGCLVAFLAAMVVGPLWGILVTLWLAYVYGWGIR
jgi:hypothetical protein